MQEIRMAPQLADIDPPIFRAWTARPYIVGWQLHIYQVTRQMETELSQTETPERHDDLVRKWIKTFDALASLPVEQRRAIARQELEAR